MSVQSNTIPLMLLLVKLLHMLKVIFLNAFLYVYPSMIPLQASKTKEIVMLTYLSSHVKI